MAITTYTNVDEKYLINYTLVDLNLAIRVEEILKDNQKRILNFFGRENMDITRVHIFSSIKKLKEYLNDTNIYPLEQQPDYLCACERKERIYLASKNDPYFNEYSAEEYEKIIIHEFVHLVEDKLFPAHPEWLSEGLAALLTNKYSDDDMLKVNDINNSRLPRVADMKDKKFCTDKYDGYFLSYLMVKYLTEIFSKKEFIDLLKSRYEDRIKGMEQKVLEEAIDYYRQPDLNQGLKSKL